MREGLDLEAGNAGQLRLDGDDVDVGRRLLAADEDRLVVEHLVRRPAGRLEARRRKHVPLRRIALLACEGRLPRRQRFLSLGGDRVQLLLQLALLPREARLAAPFAPR